MQASKPCLTTCLTLPLFNACVLINTLILLNIIEVVAGGGIDRQMPVFRANHTSLAELFQYNPLILPYIDLTRLLKVSLKVFFTSAKSG